MSRWPAVARPPVVSVPSKCAGPTGAGIKPNPCIEPGSLHRCQLCPKTSGYWRAAGETPAAQS